MSIEALSFLLAYAGGFLVTSPLLFCLFMSWDRDSDGGFPILGSLSLGLIWPVAVPVVLWILGIDRLGKHAANLYRKVTQTEVDTL